jgi:CheY-like chemotaxis protein
MPKVLLIEPDRLIAANVSKALKRGGYTVNCQVDPQIALDIADKDAPDVIIVDLILAGHGGVEFLYEFRSYPDWQNVPIVVFSSLSAEELKQTLKGFEHLNINAYHYKPTTALADLSRTIESVLQPAAA